MSAVAQLTTLDGQVVSCEQGGRILVGTGRPDADPIAGDIPVDVVLRRVVDAPVDISGVAIEVWAHATNVAVRVHQRLPGRLDVITRGNSDVAADKITSLVRGEVFCSTAPMHDLVLQLGGGASSTGTGTSWAIPIGELEFTADAWDDYSGDTVVRPPTLPRAMWLRYIVAASLICAKERAETASEPGSQPFVARARLSRAKERKETASEPEVRRWLIKNCSQPVIEQNNTGRTCAIRAALWWELPLALDDITWRSVQLALRAAGKPDAATVAFVCDHLHERTWSTVGSLDAARNAFARRPT